MASKPLLYTTIGLGAAVAAGVGLHYLFPSYRSSRPPCTPAGLHPTPTSQCCPGSTLIDGTCTPTSGTGPGSSGPPGCGGCPSSTAACNPGCTGCPITDLCTVNGVCPQGTTSDPACPGCCVQLPCPSTCSQDADCAPCATNSQFCVNGSCRSQVVIQQLRPLLLTEIIPMQFDYDSSCCFPPTGPCVTCNSTPTFLPVTPIKIQVFDTTNVPVANARLGIRIVENVTQGGWQTVAEGADGTLSMTSVLTDANGYFKLQFRGTAIPPVGNNGAPCDACSHVGQKGPIDTNTDNIPMGSVKVFSTDNPGAIEATITVNADVTGTEHLNSNCFGSCPSLV